MNTTARLGATGLLCLGIAFTACSTGGTSAHPTARADAIARSSAVTPLGRYNVDTSKTAIAGISSGGFMAVQMHVAFSGTFHFAAIYAGGPYYCAGDSLTTAQVDCQYAVASELQASESYLDAQSSAGTIDPKSNLNGQKAYLWSGTSDFTVEQKTMNDLNAEYQHYGVSTKYDNSYAAGHGWESPKGQVACGTTSSPYMIDCNSYDSEQTWLTYFYGSLHAKNTGTLGGSLINIDQTAFGGGANDLDTNGYLFVPAACASGHTCTLIVALDGCAQTQASIGTTFITESGLNEWADTNNILVLYPYQVSSSTPTNPNGCWDWWGYESATYAVKTGPQMAAIKKMVDRIVSGSTSSPAPSPSPISSASPTPAPSASPTPPYSQAVTDTITNQYVAGRINVTQYNQLGAKYGYLAEITLYKCGSVWTNSPTCGPLQ